MKARDDLMDSSHFVDLVGRLREELVQQPIGDYRILPKIVFAMYSGGYPMEEIRPVFKDWVRVAATLPSGPTPGEHVRLLSIALMLGVDEEDRANLERMWPLRREEEPFCAFLADALGVPHPAVKGNGYLWRFFRKVREIPDAVGKEEFLGGFLKRSWWKTWQGDPDWWSRQAAGPNYCGFWAWEVAGTVKAYGLDDSSFCDHRFYPKDMAHYLVR